MVAVYGTLAWLLACAGHFEVTVLTLLSLWGGGPFEIPGALTQMTQKQTKIDKEKVKISLKKAFGN